MRYSVGTYFHYKRPKSDPSKWSGAAQSAPLKGKQRRGGSVPLKCCLFKKRSRAIGFVWGARVAHSSQETHTKNTIKMDY